MWESCVIRSFEASGPITPPVGKKRARNTRVCTQLNVLCLTQSRGPCPGNSVTTVKIGLYILTIVIKTSPHRWALRSGSQVCFRLSLFLSPRLTLNSWPSSCLSLSSVRITGMSSEPCLRKSLWLLYYNGIRMTERHFLK